MKLYSYWRSSSSWRVRIALAWKNLPFEYAPIHLLRDGGEQWGPVHRSRSPMGKIPVLELDDGRTISESMAILGYLEEQHPVPPLLPRDPYERARARMFAEMVNSGIQPLQNLAVLKHVKHVLDRDDKAWAQTWIAQGVAALESAASDTAGRYAVGDEPSLADVYLIPQLYQSRRFAVSLDAAPTLLRIESACQELAAFAESHPDRQPDAPH